MLGVTIIVAASLSSSQALVALAFLVLAVIWLQLLPILVYLIMGQKAQAMLNSMNIWLTRNRRVVNVVVLGLFGIVLLLNGLSGLLGSG